MLYGIDEDKLNNNYKNTRVRKFPGASTSDMFHYSKPILNKKPSNLILHVGTNDCQTSTSGEVYARIRKLVVHFEKEVPGVNVIVSTVIGRTDDLQAQAVLSQVNYLLKSSDLSILDNGNISSNHLGRKGLHLNIQGVGKFALNLTKCLKGIYKPYKRQ